MKPIQTFADWCNHHSANYLLEAYRLGNNDLPAEEIGFSSAKKITLKCPKCLQRDIRSLNKVTRQGARLDCPFCNHRKLSFFYNLEVVFPEIVSIWDYNKNEQLPNQYLPYSKKRVYWCCKEGHEWSNVIDEIAKLAMMSRKNKKPLCPCCRKKKVSNQYNLLIEFPELSNQWNYARNGSLRPDDVTPYSAKKVWWRCEFNPAHEWQARISNRTVLSRDCPFCEKIFKTSKAARTIFYYLHKQVPDCICEEPFPPCYKLDILMPRQKIVIEHDGWYHHGSDTSKQREEKKDKILKEHGFRVIRIKDDPNIDVAEIHCVNDTIIYPFEHRNFYLDQLVSFLMQYLGLDDVRPDHKRDHIKIERLYYHERKKRTLAVEFPELAKEWSDKNKSKPDTMLSKSGQKVWWECPKCKRHYMAAIYNRTGVGSGCPHCTNKSKNVLYENSLAFRFPELADEWDYEKNNGLRPEDVYPGTDKKVWWRCKKGHSWCAMIYNRTGEQKVGCPICSHNMVHKDTSLKTLRPDIAKLWHPTKNGEITPDDVLARSNKKFWWKCKNGCEWEATVNRLYQIKKGKRCPFYSKCIRRDDGCMCFFQA